jgi:hypothetical protein
MGVDSQMVGHGFRVVIGIAVAAVIAAFALGAGLIGLLWYMS